MRWLLLLLPFGSFVLIACWLWRWWHRDYVPRTWLDDNYRREQSIGVEQSCVKSWPIQKVLNDAGRFNARRLRKRA